MGGGGCLPPKRQGSPRSGRKRYLRTDPPLGVIVGRDEVIPRDGTDYQIAKGEHRLFPSSAQDKGICGSHALPPRKNQPQNIRGPFRVKPQNAMTACPWDPRRCVHKSRQPLLLLPKTRCWCGDTYERSYGISKESDC